MDSGGGVGTIEVDSTSYPVTSLSSTWSAGDTQDQLAVFIGYGDGRCRFYLSVRFLGFWKEGIGTPTTDGYVSVVAPQEPAISGTGGLFCGTDELLRLGDWSGRLEVRRSPEPFVRGVRADFTATGRAPRVSVRVGAP